jgi:hypothetical protein
MVSLLFFIPVFPIVIITSYYPWGQAEKSLALAAFQVPFPPGAGLEREGRISRGRGAKKSVTGFGNVLCYFHPLFSGSRRHEGAALACEGIQGLQKGLP